MKLYVTSPNKFEEELENILEVAGYYDIIIVDSEERRKLAEKTAKRMGFLGRIEVEP